MAGGPGGHRRPRNRAAAARGDPVPGEGEAVDDRSVGPDSLIARFDPRCGGPPSTAPRERSPGTRLRNRYRRNRDERLGIDVAHCDEFHQGYDRFANKDVQGGELPVWMHVAGRVAWLVAQGPYAKMPGMWRGGPPKGRAKRTPRPRPPSDT